MSTSEASREDRQLPASERRLQQAREEGQLARSRELVHLAAALALLTLLTGLGPWLAERVLGLLAGSLRFGREAAFDAALLMPRLGGVAADGLALVLPVGFGLAVLLAATSVVVGGWNFAPQALEPRLDRLDPLAGLRRLAAPRQLLQHLRLVLVAAALGAVAVYYILRHAGTVEAVGRLALPAALAIGFGWIASGLTLLAGICVLSALADVPLQIWQHRSELRMTQEEARQEHKQDEGDPHVKGERRRRQRELARGRMLRDVPGASVVVTNPTHYAVALRYDEGTMAAPRIVAMGTDHLAARIRAIAAEARVPLLEAPPLARALYRHGEVGREVPVELYTAVAQVLAWVFRLRETLRPPAQPRIELPPGLDPLEGESA